MTVRKISQKFRNKSQEISQPAITCSKLTIETLEQGVKYVKKLTVKTPKRRHWRRSGVLIVNFEHISLLVLDFEQINASWDTQTFMYAQGRVFWAAVLKSYSLIKINTLEFV